MFGPHAILNSKSVFYDKTAGHCSTGRVIDFCYLQSRRTGTPPETQKIVDGSVEERAQDHTRIERIHRSIVQAKDGFGVFLPDDGRCPKFRTRQDLEKAPLSKHSS